MNPLLILWITFLITAGLILFMRMMKRYHSDMVVRKWNVVEGNVTHIYSSNEWYELYGNIPQSGTIKIRYSYKYAGVSYTSSSVFLNSDATIISNSNNTNEVFKRDITDFIKEIRNKPEVWVRVNPLHPRQAVLLDKLPQRLTTGMMGLVVVIWALCITIMISGSFRQNISEKVTVIEKIEAPAE